jgi:hypothetical protein
MNENTTIAPASILSRARLRRVRREEASKDVLAFARASEIPGVPVRPDDEACEEFRTVDAAFGKHHLLWLDCLRRVEDGEIKRLL